MQKSEIKYAKYKMQNSKSEIKSKNISLSISLFNSYFIHRL